MHLTPLSTLRPVGAALVLCLLAGTASAQLVPAGPDPSSPPVTGIDAGGPTEPPGGQPWLTPAPEKRETMPGFKDLFAPLAGDFKNMRFFVAKVNIGEQAKLGFNYLRPLQIAYESPKFMNFPLVVVSPVTTAVFS